MILNPHTGQPVDFSSIDPNDPMAYQKLLQLAGLGGAIQAGPGGGERMRGASGGDLAALMAQQGMYDPEALDGYTAGQGRQDYDLTTYLRDPSGNLAAQETNYDRESYNGSDWLDVIGKSLATVGAVYGAGTGLSALGLGGAGGTATLGAGSLATPIGTSSALPALGTMATPTAASLGLGEIAALGTAGAGGGIATLGAGSLGAPIATSSALPSLGSMAAPTAASLGLGELASLTGGGLSLGAAAGAAADVAKGVGSIGKYVAPVVGGLLGGIDGAKGSEDSTTTQSKLDPNMQRLLYGEDGRGGLLGDMAQHFKGNMGINATARQGLDMQKAFYSDPGYAQGYNQMRSQGLGLLGQPVAGNPFTRKGG